MSSAHEVPRGFEVLLRYFGLFQLLFFCFFSLTNVYPLEKINRTPAKINNLYSGLATPMTMNIIPTPKGIPDLILFEALVVTASPIFTFDIG